MLLAKQWARVAVYSTLAASVALTGCNKKEEAGGGAAAAGAQQMPPPEVTVVVAQKQAVEQTVDLAGRTAAYQISEVRPQVSGIVQKRLFVEGSYVKEGQPLYSIDANTYQATVSNARAALNRQIANLNALKVKENRYRQLVGTNAISKQEYDDVAAQVALAQADVAASRATLENANISLGYATVRAPISGQTSRSNVTAGALVTAGQADPMVTVQQLDPIYVDISQSSADLLRLRQQMNQGQLSGADSSARVKLTLEDGSTYPVEGRLAFSGVSVDPSSGAVTLRAIFANPSHLLLPGMYVTAKLVQGVNNNAMLIPQQAVTRTPQGDANVMVINNQGMVEVKPVVTAGTQGSYWIINSGLNEGDKVIVEGIAKVQPGAPAKAVLAQPKAEASQNAAGSNASTGAGNTGGSNTASGNAGSAAKQSAPAAGAAVSNAAPAANGQAQSAQQSSAQR
ncbi:efflux RND transporter periplasmic adaptor subunit [Alkanindiges illinoisensis]|uniref:efflux RND transporter periplasmic adaptor subunit n=1 Tax=Alkanindiges illinoisensis TaxID=197183 RepID=UPI0009FC07E2